MIRLPSRGVAQAMFDYAGSLMTRRLIAHEVTDEHRMPLDPSTKRPIVNGDGSPLTSDQASVLLARERLGGLFWAVTAIVNAARGVTLPGWDSPASLDLAEELRARVNSIAVAHDCDVETAVSALQGAMQASLPKLAGLAGTYHAARVPTDASAQAILGEWLERIAPVGDAAA